MSLSSVSGAEALLEADGDDGKLDGLEKEKMIDNDTKQYNRSSYSKS